MKTRFARAEAIAVARLLCRAMEPACHRLIVAGSLRRGKDPVGDVEILYIPKREMRPVPGDLFAARETSLTDLVLDEFFAAGELAKRLSIRGHNKLLLHTPTGIPVDLFATTADAWPNYLVCRTGPADLNREIAARALAKGYRWNPYGTGFSALTGGGTHTVREERDVFDFVGLPFLPATERRWPLSQPVPQP